MKKEYNNESTPKTYAIATSQVAEKPEDLRKIMLSTRNEEIIEEKDEKAFITRLKEAIGANEVKQKSISRIGQLYISLLYATDKTKRRPIKGVFKNSSDKDKVFDNLYKFKGNVLYISILHLTTISPNDDTR